VFSLVSKVGLPFELRWPRRLDRSPKAKALFRVSFGDSIVALTLRRYRTAASEPFMVSGSFALVVTAGYATRVDARESWAAGARYAGYSLA